jgi:hypothetical protein
VGTSGKMIVAFFFFLNILAVLMGYAGIDKLQRYEYPPFHDSGGLWTVFNTAKYVPDRVVSFWHSTPGTCLVWAGSIIIPLAASYLIFANNKMWTGIILLMTSFVLFGLTGFLIWLHAFCDLTHER